MCCVPINQISPNLVIENWCKCDYSTETNNVEMVKCSFCKRDLRKINSYFGLSEDGVTHYACKNCADKQKEIVKQNSKNGFEDGKNGLAPQSTDKYYFAAYIAGRKEYVVKNMSKIVKGFKRP